MCTKRTILYNNERAHKPQIYRTSSAVACPRVSWYLTGWTACERSKIQHVRVRSDSSSPEVRRHISQSPPTTTHVLPSLSFSTSNEKRSARKSRVHASAMKFVEVCTVTLTASELTPRPAHKQSRNTSNKIQNSVGRPIMFHRTVTQWSSISKKSRLHIYDEDVRLPSDTFVTSNAACVQGTSWDNGAKVRARENDEEAETKQRRRKQATH